MAQAKKAPARQKPGALKGIKFSKGSGAGKKKAPAGPDYSGKFSEAVRAFESGEGEKAEPLFQELAGVGYRKADCLAYLGVLKAKQGEEEEGEALIKQAMQEEPGNGWPLMAMAELNALSDDFLGAIDYAGKAVEKEPENPWFEFKLGDYYLRLDDKKDAVTHFKTAVKKYSESENKKGLGKANYELGKLEAEKEEYYDAVQHLYAACKAGEKKAESQITLLKEQVDRKWDGISKGFSLEARKALERGNAALSKSDGEGAVNAAEEATRLDPKFYEAYAVLGYYQLVMGNTSKAVKSLEKAISLNPEYYLPYNTLGMSYFKQGAYENALEYYTKAIERYPFNPFTFQNRADVYVRLSKPEKALEDLGMAIALKPEDRVLSEMLANRAEVYLILGERAKAEKDVKDSLRFDSSNETAKKVEKSLKTELVTGMKDVIGMGQLKETLMEAIIFPFKRKDLAKKYAMSVGGGVLLYGPPGCGKTYIAKAIAKEAGVSFFEAKISDIVGSDPGETEKNIHNLFEKARNAKPAIVFMDEVDALGSSREQSGTGSERRAINQLLTEIDGTKKKEGILVLGATNTPWDVDTALKRSGRFSKAIYVPPPDEPARKGLFKFYLGKRPYDEDVDFGELAVMSDGLSPADIKAVCDEAATYPWKEAMKTGEERPVNMEDLRKALDNASSAVKEWYKKIESHLDEPGAREIYKDLFDDLKKYGGFDLMTTSALTFDDVAGMEELKKEIKAKIIEPLKHPELSEKYGMKAGGGILLYGPPGCGKTYIMKAAAGEGGVSFISAKISDVVSKYVGESEQKLHKIFETARKNKPCILFFDEIDAFGGARGGETGDSDTKLVNQMLTEMDGVGSSSEGILIVGATNLPWKVDVALRRVGRLGDSIYVPAPDMESRIGIMEVATKGKPVAGDVDFEALAKKMEGYSSSDVAGVCKKAVSQAWKEAMETGEEREVAMGDFEKAVDSVVPSIQTWYSMAEKELRNTPDKELFKPLLDDVKSVGKAKTMGKTGVTFDDVAGMDGLKKKIKAKVLGPLKHPEIAKKYGVKAGGGILLYGPPGCGKTYIMKAAAGEGGVSFVSARLSDILSKYVGESEENLHNLFETARKNSPCILFFDEIDTLGSMRGAGQDEHTAKLVNQMLMEMDGVMGGAEGVLIVGATNVPWKVDLALRRTGRLGSSIYVPPPDKESRKAMFQIHLRGKPVAGDVDFEELAEQSEGFSASDISGACEEALSDVYQEAMETGEERPVNMGDLARAIEAQAPSVFAWYELAGRELAGAPDKDLFKELFDEIARLQQKKTGKPGET